MIQYTCPQCETQYVLKNTRKRVFCSCGGIAHNPEWNGKPTSSYGPGDAMGEITKELGIPEKTGCGCNQLATKMNTLGIEGCESKREELKKELACNGHKYSWLETLKIAATNMSNPMAIAFGISGDVYGAMLDEAIRRTRQKMTEQE